MGRLKTEPCKECPVEACCSKVCRKHAEYVYDNPDLTPEECHKQIYEEMTRDEAIDHIRMVENVALVFYDES